MSSYGRYCPAERRDGHPCSSWVNAAHDTYCTYHAAEALRKERRFVQDVIRKAPAAAPHVRWAQSHVCPTEEKG